MYENGIGPQYSVLSTDWPFTDPKWIKPPAKIWAFRPHKDRRCDDFRSHFRPHKDRSIYQGPVSFRSPRLCHMPCLGYWDHHLPLSTVYVDGFVLRTQWEPGRYFLHRHPLDDVRLLSLSTNIYQNDKVVTDALSNDILNNLIGTLNHEQLCVADR
jgi:hypothetical protein